MDEKRQRISEQAYYHWEREGRPLGKEQDHWLKAESELAPETVEQDTGKKKSSTPPAARAAEKAPNAKRKAARKKAGKRAVKKKAK